MGNTKSNENIKEKVECIIVEPKEIYLKLDKIKIHNNIAFIYFISKKQVNYNNIKFMINLPNKEIIEKTINLNSSLTENNYKRKTRKKKYFTKKYLEQ